MKIKENKIEQFLLFILGLFATFQLTEVFGITIYTGLMFLTLAFFVVKYKKCGRCDVMMLVFIAVATISELVFVIIGKNNMWKTSSVKAYILLIVVFLLYFYMKKVSTENIRYFLQGLYLSCIIQLIWCVLQIVLNKAFGINLNKFIFTEVFNYQGAVTQTKNGTMIITGLNSNAGMLVPIFLMGIFLSTKLWIKGTFLVMMFLLGSITPVIAACCYIAIYGIYKLRVLHKSLDRKRYMRIIYILGGIFIVSVIVIILGRKFQWSLLEPVNGVIDRVFTIIKGTNKDASSNVHLRYYWSLPDILANNNIFVNMFGHGVKCAGLPFVELFNQYPGFVWVPESDVVTYLMNVGILGTVSFYAVLIYGIYKGYKVDKKYLCFQLTILIAGVFYGIQLNWVILCELLLFEMINRKIKVNELLLVKNNYNVINDKTKDRD